MNATPLMIDGIQEVLFTLLYAMPVVFGGLYLRYLRLRVHELERESMATAGALILVERRARELEERIERLQSRLLEGGPYR